MNVNMVPIDQVRPYENNPRLNETAVAKVAESLRAFGFRQPIVVDSDGIVVVGHTRLLAARQLGMTEIPVHVAMDLTPLQTRAYRLADNRTHEESDWDDTRLVAELTALQRDGMEMSLTGFDEDELTDFLNRDDSPAAGNWNAESPAQQWLCVIECQNESQLRTIYQELHERGYTCKLVT